MSWFTPRLALLAIVCKLLTCWQIAGSAQQKRGNQNDKFQLAKPGTRFEFEIVENFDAKYEGDTPGHIGHAGGLGSTRPHVSLGDSIYRGEEVAGKVTTVTWSHVKGSLTIEFDPQPLVRVAVEDYCLHRFEPQFATEWQGSNEGFVKLRVTLSAPCSRPCISNGRS